MPRPSIPPVADYEELLVDVDGAPCPRCGAPLAGAPDSGEAIHACASCGGCFVDHPTLAARVRIAKAKRESAPMAPARHVEPPPAERDVRLLSCPACSRSMQRMACGRRSGIVVDVCRAHGTWLDRGEIEHTAEFVECGGLEPAEADEAEGYDATADVLEMLVDLGFLS